MTRRIRLRGVVKLEMATLTNITCYNELLIKTRKSKSAAFQDTCNFSRSTSRVSFNRSLNIWRAEDYHAVRQDVENLGLAVYSDSLKHRSSNSAI